MLRARLVLSVVAAGVVAGWSAVGRAAAGDVIATIDAPGDSGSGLGWDGEHLWVANLQTALGGGSNRVTIHDPIDGTELDGFNMAAGDVFHGIAFDAAGAPWTDNFNDVDILLTDIVRLDPDTGAVQETLPAYGTIYGVAIDPETSRLFQVDNHSVLPDGDDLPAELYVVALPSGDRIAGPLETTIVGARGVAWDGFAVWVASNATDTLYRVDITDGTTIDHVVGPGAGGVEGVAWDGACLWVSDTADDTLYRIDHGQGDLPECEPFSDRDTDTDTDTDGAGTDSDETDAAGTEDVGTLSTDTSAATDSPPGDTAATTASAGATDTGLGDTTAPTASGGASPSNSRAPSGCACHSPPARSRPTSLLLLLLLLAPPRARLRQP